MWGREHEKDGIQLYKNMLAGSGSNEYLINDEPIIIHENLEVVPLGLCVLQPNFGIGHHLIVLFSVPVADMA